MPPRPRIKHDAASRCRLRLRPATCQAAAFCRAPPAHAPFATKVAPSSPPTKPKSRTQAQPPSRWVSDVRARIGKCLTFGCDAAQIQRAAGVLGILAREWRVLSAGSEGFLTGGRRGLEDQQVVWGEMDSFVGSSCSCQSL
jgi:hypothetical protein